LKKWLVGLIVLVLLASCSYSIYAAPSFGHNRDRDREHGPGPGPGPVPAPQNKIRDDARYIIHRTAAVIDDAQQAAERRHRYMGLAQAVGNQQQARRLYMNGNYRDAIFHSLRARDIALQIIRDNGRRPRPDYFRDNMEERYAHDSPRGDDLDRRLDRQKMGKDDDAIHIRINLDL
jgi:hypothetical protein